MGITVNSIIEFIDQIAPFDTAEAWDNVGLLVGKKDQSVKNILLALDVTEEVVLEAIEKGVDLIITHHPIIFSGLKSITDNSRIGSSVLKLIENDISVISAHTNLDNSFIHGINHHIAVLYGLSDIEPLSEMHGYGVVGNLKVPLSIDAFINETKLVFKIDTVKVANHDAKTNISTVAISSGASSDYIEDALKKNVDVFIMGDLKYHEAQKVIGTGLMLADVGHYESESIYLAHLHKLLHKLIQTQDKTVEITVTTSEKPIFKYL